MTDIVKWLRLQSNARVETFRCHEAADEIEKLRGYLDEVRAELVQVYEKTWQEEEEKAELRAVLNHLKGNDS